ncbi:MAG: helix-turn-helix transcriptional regulator [Acidobacteria bacterium]|nr:helix-turn-helix transcriptional regulator [Acidobacteriota bacterium]
MKTSDASYEVALDDEFRFRLGDLRRRKGWSRSDLGERAGVTASIICYFERGRERPNAWSIRRLAAALGVTEEYLARGPAGSAPVDKELFRRFQDIALLPVSDRESVNALLDAFLETRKM